MFENMTTLEQYLMYGVLALIVTVIALALYNRREKRRKHAIELANLMNKWELTWFAETYEDYAVGDYSGLSHKIKEVITAVRSDEAMVAKLKGVTKKVVTHAATNDQSYADELRAILNVTN